MCGICGLVGVGDAASFDKSVVERMRGTLVHRGPDDLGIRVADFTGAEGSGRVGLGHTRLSIIDLAGGHQPLSNEDESIWIVFNGEIYNYQELRPGLEARGHRFRTNSDTEAIVHLYEEKGPECLHDLRGMFAFAIWDGPRRRLFCARDRLGKKPLAYHAGPRRIAFGSEIKAVLQAPGLPRELDREALHHYLTYQYVPHPATMFRGIHKLPPGHYLLWENGRLDVREYWRPPFQLAPRLSEREYVDRLRALMTESVRLRMISDVPLGAFLSGGIDSSIVVALMAGLSSEPVRTFSIGFEEKRYDEVAYARMVAKRYGTEHREFVVRPNAVEIIPKLVRHYDEPYADSSAIPTFYVSELTRRHVKVALTGDAGDEGFAGYPRYRAVKLAAMFDKLPGPVRRALAGRLWRHFPVSVEAKTFRRRLRRLFEALNLPPRERYVRWCAIFDDERKDALYSPEMRASLAGVRSAQIFEQEYDKVPEMDFLGATTFVDFMRYLPDDLLVKVDIASMAHGLECRAPFLDHKLVEFIGQIPTDLKMHGLTPKYLLRKAFGDLLPPEILKRPKMGFGVPIAEWFRRDLSGYVQDVLLDDSTLRRGYFDSAFVRQLVEQHTSARWDHGYRLWSLLMFELWHREYLDGG